VRERERKRERDDCLSRKLHLELSFKSISYKKLNNINFKYKKAEKNNLKPEIAQTGIV
jgi:hypothetical protein